MSLVITLGRQNGSGGREIGFRLARELDLTFYDNNLLSLTAERTNFDVNYVKERSEQAPRLWAAFVQSTPLGPLGQTPLPDSIFEAQAETIKEVAKIGNCLIVGRASDYILRNTKAVHIFVYAPIEARVARKLSLLPEGTKVTPEEMRRNIEKADRARASFYSYFTGQEWGVGERFDLNLNTGKIGVEGAVKVIKDYLSEIKE